MDHSDKARLICLLPHSGMDCSEYTRYIAPADAQTYPARN